MGVYSVKVTGRRKRVLVKEESLAKAKDRVVTAELLNAEQMAAAMEDGETIWKDGEPFPADEPAPESDDKDGDKAAA